MSKNLKASNINENTMPIVVTIATTEQTKSIATLYFSTTCRALKAGLIFFIAIKLKKQPNDNMPRKVKV